MSSSIITLLSRIFVCWLVMATAQIPFSQVAFAQETDPEEAKEKSIVERFVVVLEKNPRRGTALDKVYGYHVERGTLEALIKDYRAKTESQQGQDAGSAWMVIGLLEALRGQDAAAVASFEQAEKLSPQSYLASYYLGQSLVLVGQPDKAAEALERSIQRKPAQADLLDIYQALGRVYQRAQKNEQAMQVWTRLEKQFPNDPRVQEQIANTLLEESEFAAALPLFESLAKNSKDKYRQAQFQMEAAGLKVRLGKSEEGIADLEKLLGQLLPENWLYRDVRRRIEAVYLRTDDQSGLVTYYENWIKQKPSDLDAIGRLARLLAGSGRGPESQEWLLKGLKVAPKSSDLRQALISQLVYEQKYSDAIAQYEQLDKYDPNNPDTLREWGRLILKETNLDEATRKSQAASIWRRLTTAKPKDPLIASQVGELFRQAEMTDEALDYYRKAISLAPDQPQYREYLGEYFHSLKRKDEALVEWRGIAEGKLKTPANVARLAEVLSSFGYLAEAVETNAEACKLDPKDFLLQVKQADLLAQADKHDAALAQLAIVKKLAANDEEREAWISRDLRERQSMETLQARIAEVKQELQGTVPAVKNEAEQAELWYWLGRAYEADRQLKDAALALSKATQLAPQAIPVLMASARIQEAQNNLIAAVEINTKLAAIDRRYRTEYLKQVATLEQKLGRKERAVQAGRDLIAAAPGNPEGYEFFSQLCFQLGETDEGLGALRRSVRVNPTEPKGLLLLASALGEQFRTGEAIELYWRAFEKAATLEDRLGIVPKLTELYLRSNQFDRILERLERQRREPNQQREMTICLAQAYQSAGDDGNARQELEKLLTEDTRDTQLLTQLVKLCETDGDLEAAVKFQQQLLKASPGKEGTMRLAQLLSKSGETDEALSIMARVTAEEKDPETVLKSLDSMLSSGNYESALHAAEKLSRDQPGNWELLYREGYALGKIKEKGEAARTIFESILALKIPDDEPSVSEKNRLKKGQGITRTSAGGPTTTQPMTQRSTMIRSIRISSGLEEDRNYGQSALWVPRDFGQARMASLAWLAALARRDGNEADYINSRREAGTKAETRRDLIDWCYLASLAGNQRDVYLVLRKLSHRPEADSDIKSLYLRTLLTRGVGPDEVAVPVEEPSNDPDASPIPGTKLPVLSQDEMEHVLACFRSLPDATSLSSNNVDTYLQIVVNELKRSGRKDEAEVLLKETVQNAKSPLEIATLIPPAVEQNDFARVMRLLHRLTELKSETNSIPSQNTRPTGGNSAYLLTPESQAQTLCKLMDKRAQKNKLDDLLELWDWYVPTALSRSQQSKLTMKKRNSSASQNIPAGYVLIWQNNSNQYHNLDFPASNEIFDQPSIQMLRQIFVIYESADQSKELLDHFRQKLADSQTPAEQKNFWKFAVGYLLWWGNEKDDAIQVLTEATAEIQDGDEMRFELARAHEKRGEHELALEIVDALPISDQQAMQKREIAALRMAVNAGNLDRSRLAAERLFGLRLDSGLQIQLAQQMHQLGMHEQAEAVLSRAGRQAGNRMDVLANLMQQYQSQGKNEIATQMAYQLLRRVGNRGSGGRSNSYREEASARQHAFTVLKRSGKLPEMIAKVEGQLKNSPKSQKLLETLIEYHMANGNDKKASELAASLVETKQDDAQFRFSLGKQLMEQGKHADAAGHFKIAFKKDPRLMRNDFYQILNSFQNADKMDELASIFEDLDLKGFRQSPWELTNAISNLSYQEKSKSHAIKLFKRAWEELPDQRSQLLSSLNNDIFWQMPEIYDYAKQGIIPQSEAALTNGNWPGFGQLQSWGNQDGKIVTLITRFISLAATQRKLDELVTEIEAAQKKVPQWEAAGALIALIDLRRGRIDSAKETFERLLPTFKSSKRGDYTHWEIGQELMEHEKCAALAVAYLEAASKDPNVMQMAQMNGFQYSPGKSLIAIYSRTGRKEDARKLLLSSTSSKGSRQAGNEAWEAYQRIQSISSLANEVKELGYPVDAIRLYQDQLLRSDDFVIAAGVYGVRSQGISQMEHYKTQMQSGMQSAIKQLRPELLPQLLTDRRENSGAKDDPSGIDLIMMLDSRELDRIELSSVFGKLVLGLSSRPELLEKTRQSLTEFLAERSTDLSARVLDSLLSLALKDAEATAKVTNQLVELVETMPLEPTPSKGGYTAKQREAAIQQVGLWLVARECLKQESLQTSGQKLAQRALEASRRLPETSYTLAILREMGQIALQQKDEVGAKARWTEMMEIVLPQQGEKGKRQAPEEDDKPAADPTGLKATDPNSSPKSGISTPSKGFVVTLNQFEQLTQLAKLAADHGIQDLAIEAMKRALQSGPPIQAMLAIDINQNASLQNAQDNEPSPVAIKVEEQLTKIESLWRQKGLSEESIYEMLEQAVVPQARPHEVFLHPKPLIDQRNRYDQNAKLQTLTSVGALLAASSVKAAKVDRLKELLEPRSKQPLGEVSARVLLVQLALTANDFPEACQQMEHLANRLKQDSSRTSNELASHAASAALLKSETKVQATELLEQITEHLSQSLNPDRGGVSAEPLRTLRFSLARSYFRDKNREGGKRQLEEYLTSLSKMFQNYGGDYGQYLRRREFLSVAEEYAKGGQQEDLLDCLGRYADQPVTQNYGSVEHYSGTMMAALFSLPEENRYEILKTWTLPSAERNSVRMVAGLLPGNDSPPRFDALRKETIKRPTESRLTSTADLLIQAAIDSQRLDELHQLLVPLADQKVEQADFLLQLIKIAQGNATDVLPGIQAQIDERINPKETPERPSRNHTMLDLTDAVLARAAISNEALREKGRELMRLFISRFQHTNSLMAAIGSHDFCASFLPADAVDRLDHEPWNAGLKYWTASDIGMGVIDSKEAIPTGWFANEAALCRLFGTGIDQVNLNFPLTGEFEMTFDAWAGSNNESATALGYGGILSAATDIIHAQNYAYNRNDGSSEFPLRYARIKHNRFNRVRFKVRPERTEYYVNDDLIHEVTRSANSSPWINLRFFGNSSIRNLKLLGSPTIPKEVSIVPADSLLGWSSGLIGETIAPPPPDSADETSQSVARPSSPAEFDWRSSEGVIQGRRSPASLPAHHQTPSHLSFEHPLADGDRIQYEFWYESGKNPVHVHPVIGRLVFLIDSDGLNLHWLNQRSAQEVSDDGIPADNILADESIRRGRVLLIEQDWNQAEIVFKNSTINLSLNGSLIGQYKLERENTRRFGFFHDKNATSARIRKVVYTGEWPDSLSPEIAANLMAPSRDLTREERHAYSRVIDEKFQVEAVEDILAETRTLTSDDRHHSLAKWVLPNDEHVQLRLYGTFTNSNGVPSHDVIQTELTGTAGSRPGSSRVYASPELEAPVLDLIRIAKETGRLDDLRSHAEPQTDDDSVQKRSRLALRLLIEIAAGQVEEAKISLRQMIELLPTLTVVSSTAERWPELVAGYSGLNHPELRSETLPLMTAVLDQYRKKPLDPTWEARLVALRDHCQSLLQAGQVPPVGGTSPRKQWTFSRVERADSHSWAPAARWSFENGSASHLAGEGDGYAHFQSPLRGSFTIEAEVTTRRWTETNLMYHANWAGPHYSKSVINLGTLLSKSEGPKLEPVLDFEDQCRLKLEVKSNKANWFINEREVHETLLPEKPDPWLAIMTPGQSSGRASYVRISGMPEIPEELELSDNENLAGWTASLYGDPMGLGNQYGRKDSSLDAWKVASQEIVGKKFDRVRNQKRQSLLRYHRPMAEDGMVSYEFFYSKDTTHVHPALGRIAILLEPDGVKVHVLTDADSDRIGLRPDNQFPATTKSVTPESIPLKQDDWNQVQLSVVGDQVRVKLNGVDVFEAAIASWNQRQFGFFHYANQTDVRIRNVRYRGEWPKTLPDLKDQELSGTDQK